MQISSARAAVHCGIVLPASPLSFTMSFLRVARLPILVRQCTRLTTAQHQQNRGYADMSFTFASASKVFYNQAAVNQVDVPSFSGNFGILPEHVPLLAVLQPGVVTVYESDNTTKQIFVSSGSVTINDDSSVQILAEEACTLDELDGQAIREGFAKATSDLSTASTERAKAEAQIAVDCYEQLQKALG